MPPKALHRTFDLFKRGTGPKALSRAPLRLHFEIRLA
jgi:hypothetical protein